MQVIIVPTAQQHLADIEAYIAQDNPTRAASFVDELYTACMSLAHMPHRHALVAAYGNSVRRLVHGNYGIFYRVDEDAVRILAVRHGAQQPVRYNP